MGNDMPRCVWTEWEFVKRIGRGAYGTVYEAVRTDDYGVESRAAIKVISIPQDEAELDSLRTDGMDYNASKTYMRQIVDSFVNEVKLMIQLKGVPNIVSVEDYKVVERTEEIGWDISIRMELLTPLATYISDKSITEAEVAKIGCDICSALAVCENKNIIHRDIKPANIFVNEFGDFKLGDFGIAKQMESLTMDLSRKGTGAYMAPEIEKGESYNATVDLYSLGLVLYYLLNKKRLPFNDPNKQLLTPNERERAIRRRLDGEALPAPCDASPEMTGIIRCACAYNPQQRFRSADAMRNSLQLLIKEEGHVGKHKTQAAAAPADESAVVQGESEPVLSVKEDPKSVEKRTKWIRRILLIVIIIACVVVVLFVVQRIRGGRLESYYQHALDLHEQLTEDGLPDYDACIQYINEDILQNTNINQKQSLMADVYYLYADSLFEEGEYSDAVKNYWKLFQIGTENPLYYCDCAIALAYADYDTLPESYLSEARNLGLEEKNVSFAKGEIAKAHSEYDDAIEEFNKCISSAEEDDDADLQALAWLRSADVYAEEGDKNTERAALNRAKNINSSMLFQALQKLIRVDMELASEVEDSETASNYRQEAIDTLKQIEENGWETFSTYDTMIALYQQEGDFTDAENILQDTEEQYGSDYRWYMRAALLELAKLGVSTDAEAVYTSLENELFGDGSTDEGRYTLEGSIYENRDTMKESSIDVGEDTYELEGDGASGEVTNAPAKDTDEAEAAPGGDEYNAADGDYSALMSYYNTADELYKAYLADGGDQNGEMMELYTQYDEVMHGE